MSILAGFGPGHEVECVRFEGVVILGHKATDAQPMRTVTGKCKDLVWA